MSVSDLTPLRFSALWASSFGSLGLALPSAITPQQSLEKNRKKLRLVE